MENFIVLLNTTFDLLIKNVDVNDIFSIDDVKKEDKDFLKLEAFSTINWDSVFECFKKTIEYLVEYAYKNDDNGNDDIDLSQNIYDLNETINAKSKDDILNHLDTQLRLLLLKVHVLLLMFSVTATITKDISKLISSDLQLIHVKNDESFFRGHSDEKYKLIPSLFRSYDKSKYGFEMTYSTLYSLYNEPNLINKYNDIFKYKTIDESFCAFMQHACAYSPFLDLTKNHVIALSFATNNSGNLNEYFQKTAAIYRFIFNQNVLTGTPNLKDLNIYFTKGKLRLFSLFRGKFIFYCVPSTFDPSVFLLKKQTNDRMKYQDGAFLFFQSCVVVNGHVLMPYRIGKIIKYTISPNKKNVLNKSLIYQRILDNYRKYDYEHLMNPYLYFTEIA